MKSLFKYVLLVGGFIAAILILNFLITIISLAIFWD